MDVRKRIKSKKPTFTRQDAHKIKGISNKWRRPKGLQSKVRLSKKGYVRKPSQGFRSPKLVRGLNNKGLKEVLIYNIKDFSSIDKNSIAVISSTVGKKKKLFLVKEGLKNKIIFSFDANKFIKETETSLKKTKEEKKAKEKEKQEKVKKKEKQIKKKEEKTVEEEKKEEKTVEEEKKEKDKVLTKKI